MPRIAIFDSGVGGLSIHQAVQQRLPDCQTIFVSDNQAFPYGTKPEDELNQRVVEVVGRIIQQFQPDILVVACNTASTVVLPLLRARFSIPIVGVVPAIKPAAELSKTRVIGLLATPATIKRSYTDQLINDFAADCEVIRVGSSKLVQLAEDKLLGKTVDLAEIEAEIEPLLASKEMDVLVLACTHFPLLNKEIKYIFKVKRHSVSTVDSGQGIANRVFDLLTQADLLKSANNTENIAVFTEKTELPPAFSDNLRKLGFARIGYLD